MNVHDGMPEQLGWIYYWIGMGYENRTEASIMPRRVRRYLLASENQGRAYAAALPRRHDSTH